jgi:hypothetical protein
MLQGSSTSRRAKSISPNLHPGSAGIFLFSSAFALCLSSHLGFLFLITAAFSVNLLISGKASFLRSVVVMSLPLAVLYVLINLFLAPRCTAVESFSPGFYLIDRLNLCRSSLYFALETLLRLLSFFLLFPVLLNLSKSADLFSLLRVYAPKTAVILGLALYSFPKVHDDVRQAYICHTLHHSYRSKSRTSRWFKQAKMLIGSLFQRALEHACSSAETLASKGYDLVNVQRKSYLKWKALDKIVSVLSLAGLFIVAYANLVEGQDLLPEMLAVLFFSLAALSNLVFWLSSRRV